MNEKTERIRHGAAWTRALPSLALVSLLPPCRALSQDLPPALARTVAAACGSAHPDGLHSAVAGTVADSISGEAIPGARVVLVWWKAQRTSATSLAARTDREGRFVFCHLPGDVRASLTVIPGTRVSRILTGLELQGGRVHVERVRLPPR